MSFDDLVRKSGALTGRDGRASRWSVRLMAMVALAVTSCGTEGDLEGLRSGGENRAPLTTWAWDPNFSLSGCSQNEWWLEFAVKDATIAAMQVEVAGTTPLRIINLTGRVPMNTGYVKFTGSPGTRLPTGTLVRLKVTQSAAAGGKVAASNVFPYFRATPVVQCGPACVPTCAAGACGVADGCGGACGPCAIGQSCMNTRCTQACVPTWEPQWLQLSGTSAWWAQFEVAGGGVLTTAVVVENVATQARAPLLFSFGRWTGGVTNLQPGTLVVMRATNALGATAKTKPFAYLVNATPATDPCAGTAATNTTCQPLTRGLVTFSFDDSGPSQPAIGIPLLQTYGVKGTFFVVPRWHTWAALARTMLASGHEFADHSMTHATLTGLTPTQLDDELRLSRQWVLTNIGGPVDSFATPSGASNAAVISAAKRYFGNHRTAELDLNFVGTDVYKLQSDFIYNTSTVAGVCARIQKAAARKGWLFLTFHDFTTSSSLSSGFTVTAPVFEGILACATTTPGIDVVTARQATAAIRCGSSP